MTLHYCQTSEVSVYECTGVGVGEMTQEVKISAVKSDSQDLITGIHIVVGEIQFQQVVAWLLQVAKTLMIVHINTQNK